MTYTFTCKGHKIPLFTYRIQSMFDAIEFPKCLECGELMVRVYDVVPTHFAGSGWGKDVN